MGVGIVASVAYEPEADSDLVMVDASHLFPIHTTWVGFRRGTLLRNFAYDFMQLFGPHLTRRLIDQAIEAREPEAKAEVLGRMQLPIR
jgi:LysR family cys regulon transcriptional activator